MLYEHASMYISNSLVRTLDAVLAERGTTLVDVAGRDLAERACSTPWLSHHDFDDVISVAVAALRLPSLGREVGRSAPLRVLQLPAQLMLTSRTMREAWSSLARYAPSLVEDMVCTLHEDEDLVSLGFDFPLARAQGGRYLADFFAAMVARVFTQMSLPKSLLQLAALQVPRKLFDLPHHHADLYFHHALRAHADRQLDLIRAGCDHCERVKTALTYELELRELNLDRIARRVGLAPRALARELKARGTSCRQLLNEVRRDRACRGLHAGESIELVAERTGFSETSAFHRAFRRWTGLTPVRWLQRSRHALRSAASAVSVSP